MKATIAALGRRLPAPVRNKLIKVGTPLLGRLAIRGIRASVIAQDYVRAHPRGVSIVIPSYNDVPLLRKCIAGIRKTVGSTNYEIIVVDDFCEDANREKLRALAAPDTRIIFKEERQGFAVTVNRGMSEARLEDIILLNSDTIPVEGWLDELQYAAHGLDPLIGLVSPKLLYPTGRIQYGGTFHARDLAPQWFAHLYGGKWAKNPEANVSRYIFGISGACMYITRATYDELVGLDENFWLGFEDVDYAMRAWSKGFRCYYHPAATLFHLESASRGYSQGKRELSSLRYFWRKWEKLFTSKSRFLPEKGILILQDSNDGIDHVARVELLVRSLEQNGYNVTVLGRSTEDSSDIVPIIEAHQGLIVNASLALSTEAWLGAVTTSPVVQLLSEADLNAAELDSSVAAKLAPEFFYATSSRHMNNKLSGLVAWQPYVTLPIAVPDVEPPRALAVKTAVLLTDVGQVIPTGFLTDTPGLALTSISSKLDAQALSQIELISPELIIDVRANTLPGEFAVIAARCGVVISWMRPEMELTAQDGFNTLASPQSDWSALTARINDVVTDPDVYIELSSNSRALLDAARADFAMKATWLVNSLVASEIR